MWDKNRLFFALESRAEISPVFKAVVALACEIASTDMASQRQGLVPPFGRWRVLAETIFVPLCRRL